MKRLLIIFAALIGWTAIYADTDITSVTDVLYIKSGGTYTMSEDGSVVIPIYMKNTTATTATGYQFDLTLPSGVSASNVSFQGTTSRLTDAYSFFSYATQSNGDIRLIAQTKNNEKFKDTDGQVATMTIQNATAGTYSFTLSNEEISNLGTAVKPSGSFVSTVTVEEFKYADGYFVETLPFSINTSTESTVSNVFMNAAVACTSVSFKIAFSNTDFKEKGLVTVSSAEPRNATVTITANSDGTYNVEANRTTGTFTEGANTNISKFTIYSQDEVKTYTIPDGIYRVDISNIVFSDGTNTFNAAPYSADIYVSSTTTTPTKTITGGKVSYYGDYSATDTYALLTASMPSDNTVTEIDLTNVTALPSGTTSITVPNSNALIETSKDLGLTQNNVVIGTTCASLYITDPYTINYPTAFTATKAVYDRSSASVTKSRYATVYLPYSFDKTGLKVMTYTSHNNNTVTFTEITGNPVANTPYIIREADDNTESSVSIKMTNNSSTPISETSTITDTQTGFYGTYTSKTIKGTEGGYNYYGFSTTNGDFRQANEEGNTCSPFRAFFKIPTGEAIARSVIKLNFADTPTGISETSIVEAGENAAPIYRLDGTRVKSITNGGIFIQGGRKIISK